MHENVPQPRVVDRAAGRGAGCLGHGHRARGRDRPPPCPGAARHPVRPAAAQAHPESGTVTNAHGHAHPGTVTNTHRHAHPGTVTNTHRHAHPGTVTNTEGLAHPVPDADTISDAGTVTVSVTGTHQRPIGAQQRSEPRGVH
jgi:hypothetical protein